MFFIVWVSLFITSNNVFATNYREESKLPLKDVIHMYGYPFEEHVLTTSDGYILTAHRIRHGKYSNRTNKNPVLFGHGLGATSEGFLALGNISLPYFLADNGYDVWMMNARGNIFSRKHVSLYPNSTKFWNFCVDEISLTDFPATIDYVLNATNTKSLFYIGHSQGTTNFFILTSAKPEYNKKFKLGVNFAPSVYYKFEERVAVLIPVMEMLLDTMESLNILEVGLQTMRDLIFWLAVNMPDFCEEFLSFFLGSPFKHDRDVLFWIIRTIPSGISIHQLKQTLCQYTIGEFGYYDYGVQGNQKKYHSNFAPLFNLSNSVSPKVLVYSEKDWLTTPEAVHRLGSKLSNVTYYKVPDKDFTHFDYLINPNSIELVYKPILKIFNKYK